MSAAVTKGSSGGPAWWRNVPIPDGFVTAILLGLLLQAFAPQSVFALSWIGYLMGGPIIAAGLLLSWRSVLAARAVDVEDPDALVTTGPYAYSRNPMYLAWTLLALGLGLVLNTLWIPLLEVGALLYTATYVVPLEEKQLAHKFGGSYARYSQDVRRYF